MNFDRPHPSVRDVHVRELLPMERDIDKKYCAFNSPFREFLLDWVSRGLPSVRSLYEKEGVSKPAALDHLSRIINSNLVQADRKLNSCSYLMDRWFDVKAYDIVGTPEGVEEII